MYEGRGCTSNGEGEGDVNNKRERMYVKRKERRRCK